MSDVRRDDGHALYVAGDVWEKIKAIAEREDRSISKQANRMLRDYIEQQEKKEQD